MNMQKIHVKKGDTVVVLSGNDKGKSGKVLRVDHKKGRVVVENLNLVKKHQRPDRENPKGGIIEIPAPMNSSKVMVVCPNCGQATRIKKELQGDKKVRICKKCDKAID
ncbi:MAG: 50S ribosomal protein L24 [Bacillota bacterium]|jgi:large subunit ribosomal protein L24|nr:50S ribosomal protein L24 [Bacillota bacterium]NLU54688.1 50S ribosomal protein L24 [Bacillota bacterium]HOA90471.1 50S ribosomal protein L24 [Bacillota bacterium]HOJ46001.1 50S ribosomal protein L24 [Bacillota bacterium]HOL12782.1 50S ribosomal protein L24 [Bacillota bacterium]